MNKHLKICAANEGIVFNFDNGDIISFQDNFKYLGDVPLGELLPNLCFSS